MALTLDKYACDNDRRGRCIIINQHHFDKRLTGHDDRAGTNVDAERVEALFSWLGFQVTRFDDLSTNEIFSNLREGTCCFIERDFVIIKLF